MNPSPLHAGIDEVGRGCVIGPMVIGIVAGTDEDVQWMKNVRVRDSKKIPAKERDRIAEQIRERCWHKTILALPKRIDDSVRAETSSLNTLERDLMRELIRAFQSTYADQPAEIIVDAVGYYPERFAQSLRNGVCAIPHHQIIAEHRADANHLIVGAASIVAKAERERLIAQIRSELGVDLGSGYCSDPKTKRFLTTCPRDCEHVRWSWKTMGRETMG